MLSFGMDLFSFVLSYFALVWIDFGRQCPGLAWYSGNHLYLSSCMRPNWIIAAPDFLRLALNRVPIWQSSAKPCGVVSSEWARPIVPTRDMVSERKGLSR